MNERVHVQVKDGIAEVRLGRPEKRNALDQEMFEGLVRAGKELSADPSVGGASWFQLPAWIWYEAPFPVIAAVQGAAYGAGLHIALGADMRIVTPSAKLAFSARACSRDRPEEPGCDSQHQAIAQPVGLGSSYRGARDGIRVFRRLDGKPKPDGSGANPALGGPPNEEAALAYPKKAEQGLGTLDAPLVDL